MLPLRQADFALSPDRQPLRNHSFKFIESFIHQKYNKHIQCIWSPNIYFTTMATFVLHMLSFTEIYQTDRKEHFIKSTGVHFTSSVPSCIFIYLYILAYQYHASVWNSPKPPHPQVIIFSLSLICLKSLFSSPIPGETCPCLIVDLVDPTLTNFRFIYYFIVHLQHWQMSSKKQGFLPVFAHCFVISTSLRTRHRSGAPKDV